MRLGAQRHLALLLSAWMAYASNGERAERGGVRGLSQASFRRSSLSMSRFVGLPISLYALHLPILTAFVSLVGLRFISTFRFTMHLVHLTTLRRSKTPGTA